MPACSPKVCPGGRIRARTGHRRIVQSGGPRRYPARPGRDKPTVARMSRRVETIGSGLTRFLMQSLPGLCQSNDLQEDWTRIWGALPASGQPSPRRSPGRLVNEATGARYLDSSGQARGDGSPRVVSAAMNSAGPGRPRGFRRGRSQAGGPDLGATPSDGSWIAAANSPPPPSTESGFTKP